MDLASNLYLTDIMNDISQGFFVPAIIVLILFVLYALWSIGSILVELVTERRNFRVSMPEFLSALTTAAPDDVPGVVMDSGLLKRQKAALLVLWDYRTLPESTHIALAKRLLANEEERYNHVVSRNMAAAKVAPMFGLMGTLIPLGPGIVALGQGDTATLASSIGVAFNTTVCGLIAAAVCYVVGKIRANWYENYMTSLESAATSVLEIVADAREAGTIDIAEPGHSARELLPQRKGKLTDAERIAKSTIADDAAAGAAGAGAKGAGADAAAAGAGAKGAAASSSDGDAAAGPSPQRNALSPASEGKA